MLTPLGQDVNMSNTPPPNRIRVFLSHRRDDDVTDIRKELALGGFLVEDASEIRGGALFRDVIVDTIAAADALVAVADGESPNVMFEAGIAAAAGVPVVIVTSSPLSLPADLATFQSTPRNQLGVLAAQLGAAANPPSKIEDELSVPSPDADEIISESEVAELFRTAGAEVLVSRREPRSRGQTSRARFGDLV